MICNVDGCDRIVQSLGYCTMHYYRFYRTGDPGKAEPMRVTAYTGETCSAEDCGRLADRDGMCTPHYRSSTEERQYNYKSSQLKTRFNISLEDYSVILYDVQGGCCPLCLDYAPSISAMLEDKFWPVDHDHACCSDRRVCGDCIRGVVCEKCNSLLVALWDDEDWRSRAFAHMGWQQ